VRTDGQPLHHRAQPLGLLTGHLGAEMTQHDLGIAAACQRLTHDSRAEGRVVRHDATIYVRRQ